jgi:hypothetical protein
MLFNRNPKYNGSHPCPQCDAKSEWKAILVDNRLIRVRCNGKCGTYEENYSRLSDMPYFDAN